MNVRGGCCVARYSGGGGGDSGGGELSYGMSKVERIMLKFRPIAPKPLAAGSGSSCSTMDNSDGYQGTRRRKRKYIRVNGNKAKKDASTVSKKKKVSPSSSSVSGGGDPVVTLSLMPETPDRKEKSPTTSENPDLLPSFPILYPSPIMVSFNNQRTLCDGSVAMAPVQVVSVVTMECVTETWVNVDGGPRLTDEARVMKMEMDTDTCPSFVTNSRDMVVWTNRAYREMTGSNEVVKKYNRVTMPISLRAFTCKVKVTWGSEGRVTAPCDVWRLQSGGYAWLLDVKAALSLGR